MSVTETIVAIATPPGRGGIGIIRVSGSCVVSIAKEILGKLPTPRYAEYLPFLNSNSSAIDYGIALYFPAPKSFTGEDVLELQGHGGPIVLDMLLTRVLGLGARLARPGEFSEQAFLNGQLDLVQAEAIADLIDSASTAAATAAVRSLQGEFSKKIQDINEALIAVRVFVESAIDFPEEEIDFLAESDVVEQVNELSEALVQVLGQAKQGSLLREGMRIVLAGKPNVGKSSVLNRLANQDLAIVTPLPGTTRDVIREQINIEGLPLHIMDTAGLRQTDDLIEQEGVSRAWSEINKADHVLIVLDERNIDEGHLKRLIAELPDHINRSLLFNKIDLGQHEPSVKSGDYGTEIYLSAATGQGFDLLKTHLKKSMGFNTVSNSTFLARRRHLDALKRALTHLKTGLINYTDHHAAELLAEDLRQAQNTLAEITGEFTSEDLLGQIFESFCIGK
ncbi:MAG: tRNA uridine-5-carboxymethylaminomethyl(34) synthesis GTPase MnmE [Gammaproteobacteria bacterium]|nr:tRNA uridine-5-carboxymethylaminomethyl(34) synthesis GTPase MnmE [Gammaproteobacteria bacterium]